MDVGAYTRELMALLPPGAAWQVEAGTFLRALLEGIATELARVDARSGDLVDEWDPRTTSEMLTDWERILGLPDGCTDQTSSIALRRAAVVARVAGIGGQTAAYFIKLAAAMGYTITITEFRPFRVNSAVNDPLCGTAWAYAWQVNAPLNTVRRMSVLGPVNEPLASWSNGVLECVLTRLKPAHTHVLFSYT